MAINMTSRLSVPPEVLCQEIQGESVLLNLTTGRYFGLNKVGHAMWQACASSKSLEEAAEKLAPEYDVEPDRLRQDLHQLAEKLVDHGLLAVAD